nr:TonB-dependent receptor [Pectobacterium colocasium]
MLPGWDITASYTYSENKNPSLVQSQGSPRHASNVWTSYEIQSGSLQGAGASVGVSGTSRASSGRGTQSFDIGSQYSTDASVFYRQPVWSLTLGVNNVFDRDIYYPSSTRSWVGVKDGRVWRLTGTYSF